MANGLFISDFRGAGSPGAPGVGSTQRGIQSAEQGRLKLARQKAGQAGLIEQDQLAFEAAQRSAALGESAQPGLVAQQARDQSTAQDKFELDSVVSGAQQVSVIPTRQGQLDFLKNRQAEIVARGGNTEHTDEGIELLERAIRTGDSTEFDQSIQDILTLRSGEGLSAGQKEFRDLTVGLSPEDELRARRTALGLDPRAVGSSSQTIADEGTTSKVAKSEAEIEGEKTRAQEEARVDVKVGTAEKVGNAERKLKFLSETGTLEARDRNLLEKTSGSRIRNIKKAESFKDALTSGLRSSGVGRQAALFAPIGVWTDQGSFDEIFNSFAEVAARERLKASGELRPTDADVQGMKAAMFGVGRSEPANIELLKDFIAEQRAMETKLSQPTGQPIEQAPEASEGLEAQDTGIQQETGTITLPNGIVVRQVQ